MPDTPPNDRGDPRTHPDYLHPSKGGCWFCHLGNGLMAFCTEFDTEVHPACARKAVECDPHNEEALLILREVGPIDAMSGEG